MGAWTDRQTFSVQYVALHAFNLSYVSITHVHAKERGIICVPAKAFRVMAGILTALLAIT